MSSKHKYQNSRIVEAVCEFRFSPETPSDLSIIAPVYYALKEDFPIVAPEQRFMFSPEADQETFGVPVTYKELTQFRKPGSNIHIAIGTHHVSVHHLRPYTSWEDYLPIIIKGYEAYQNSANNEAVLQRIGLRYINIFEFKLMDDNSDNRLDDYFNILQGTEKINSNLINFISGIVLAHADGRDALKTQLNLGASSTADVRINLDLEYYTFDIQKFHQERINVLDWLEGAHEEIENSFERSITQKMRDVLQTQ